MINLFRVVARMVGVPDHLTWNQRQAVGINQKVIQIIDQELSILLLDLDVCVIRVGPDRNRVSAGSIAGSLSNSVKQGV